MTKTKRNVTIYSGVIILFGLILTIILVVIYERIEVKSQFSDESLHLGSYAVRDFKENLDYVSFSMSDADDFIERHVINHEKYVDKFSDHINLVDYYVFLKDEALFTLKYDHQLDMFYLYSGKLSINYNDDIYIMPYIEINQGEVNLNIFSSYVLLKSYYENLNQVIINDDLKVIRLKSYHKDQTTGLIKEKDVLLTYLDDKVMISFA